MAGWDAERTWGSLESEIVLRAIHDNAHTELRSGRIHPQGAYLWATTALLFLDAGGLDRLARQAAHLDDRRQLTSA